MLFEQAQPPQIKKRLQTVQTIAGKVFRFQIPADTFSNGDDGDTRSLQLEIIPAENESLTDMSWIGFDAEKQVLMDSHYYLLLCRFLTGFNRPVYSEINILNMYLFLSYYFIDAKKILFIDY